MHVRKGVNEGAETKVLIATLPVPPPPSTRNLCRILTALYTIIPIKI